METINFWNFHSKSQLPISYLGEKKRKPETLNIFCEENQWSVQGSLQAEQYWGGWFQSPSNIVPTTMGRCLNLPPTALFHALHQGMSQPWHHHPQYFQRKMGFLGQFQCPKLDPFLLRHLNQVILSLVDTTPWPLKNKGKWPSFVGLIILMP